MRIYDIIQKKKMNEELTDEEIHFFVSEYTKGNIDDCYISALLMAIYFNKMNKRETASLTKEICNSGEMIDLSFFGGKTVDKHSTGGVGDKTTLVVAPIAASLGCKVAKMSGRGLGHTGGTVDKLESIPGYKVTLSKEDFFKIVEHTGVSVIGQSGNLAPADKKIYALRDQTATIDNVSLIASSIMGKKLASGADSIVLDVKCGSGAFMKNQDDAKELAKEMVDIGKRCNKNIVALITNMDIPLGNYIGNRLEVKESIDVLKNESFGDLREICVCLASNMVSLCNKISYEEAEEKVEQVLENGKAFEKFKEWISFQGGDINFVLSDEFLNAKYSKKIVSKEDGFISKIDTEKVGLSACVLGAGRKDLDGEIDFTAGIIMNKKVGEYVQKGDVIAHIQSSSVSDFNEAENLFLDSLTFSKYEVKKEKLIYEIIK